MSTATGATDADPPPGSAGAPAGSSHVGSNAGSAPPPPPASPSVGGGTRDRARQARTERGRSESSAGAWAAAALVLAIGGLGFGVSAQLRANDLEGRVNSLTRSLEAQTASTTTIVPSTAEQVIPTPTQPAASTKPQPEDLAGARQSVVNAFETVYNGSLPIQNRLDLIEDAAGIGEVLQQAGATPGGQALSSIRGRVEKVTFNSATDATVQYTITVTGASPSPGRLGEAHLVGNTWKVARIGVCNDLQSLLQVTCP